MEKIYNQKIDDEKWYLKLLNTSFSVKCSFLLSFVFLFSIIFYSFSIHSSYAIVDNDRLNVETSSYYIYGNNSNLKVYKYTTNNGVPVYTLNPNSKNLDNRDFVKIDNKNNFLYSMITNGYPYKEFYDAKGNKLNDDASYWITQVSIWILYDKKINNNLLNDNQVNGIIKSNEIITTNSGSVPNIKIDDLYDNYINPLILKTNNTFQIHLKINTDSVILNKKGSYYKTGLITVDYNKKVYDFKNYAIIINDFIPGTKVYTENGVEIINISGGSNTFKSNPIEKNKRFYLEIPSKRISNKDIKINVNANVDVPVGKMYTTNDGLKLITAYKTESSVNSSILLKIDYNIKNSRSISILSYVCIFTGLFIFILGMGIILNKYGREKHEKNDKK